MAKASPKSKKASDLIRSHSVDFFKIFTLSEDTFYVLTLRLYQSHFIDQQTRKTLLSSPPRQAATALLDCMELKVDQNMKYFPVLLQSLKEEEVMADLVAKMELELASANQSSSLVFNQGLSVQEPFGNLNTGDNDPSKAIEEANKLQGNFVSLITTIVVALSIVSSPINLNLLKMRISLYFSPAKRAESHSMTEFLENLQVKADSPEAVLNFLVINNFVGYLNFKLIHIFNCDGNLNEKATSELEKYDKMHFQFYEMFTVSTIIEAFKRKPELAPVSDIDLPTFKVALNEPWMGKKVHEWKDIVSNVITLPSNLIITGIEKGSVVLTYAVLPCFVATVVEQLTDETVLKQYATVGVEFELSAYLLELGRQEIQAMNSIIEHSKLVADILSTSSLSGKHFPISTDSLSLTIEKKMKPIPQPAPKPPERGYDDDLFRDIPPEEYQCPVCRLTLREPHLLSCCGALICEFCKLHSCERCPCCRDTDHTSMLDKRTRGKILSLKVKCSSSECPWTGELLDLPAHKCPSAVVKCRYDCGEYFFASCITLHEQEHCPKRPYELIVRSHKRQLAETSSSYEKELMSKDKTIRKLEKEKSASLKKLREKVLKREKELEKKELEFAQKLLQLEETKTKMSRQEGYVTCEFPSWYGPSAVTNLHYIPPCIRAMTNFTKHKLSGDSWYSPPFYTGPGGYKLQLRVDADSSSKGTHTSVTVHLMKGEDDDCLGWPFKGSVAVKLLNWIEDKNHLEHSFSTTSAADPQSFSRVYQRQFIAHKELEFNSEKKTQYMMEDVLCFVISSADVLSNVLVPDWAYPELSQPTYGVLPVYRTINDFNQLKKNDDVYYSDPFYTTQGGYKTTLQVYPNGAGLRKGTHVSVGICLMKGENDQNLTFPFSGIFTIQLLNWKQDSHHLEKSLTFDEHTPVEYRGPVTTKSEGWGYFQYLPHAELEKTVDKAYINQDMLCFKIQFYPLFEPIQQTGSPVPSWYDVIYSESATPPCTRTLYNYTAFKRANRELN